MSDHSPWEIAREFEVRDRVEDPRRRDLPRRNGGRREPVPGLNSLDERRVTVSYAHHQYRLCADDVRLLRTVGTFRTVYIDHLRQEFPAAVGELRALERQGLISAVAIQRPATRDTSEVVTLTRAGRDLLHAGEPGTQRYHSGLIKPREVEHDAHLLPLYREEVARLAVRGATVEQVRLDVELKQALWRREDTDQSIRERAESLGLPVDAAGRVQLPDLQLLVREPDGRVTRCNIELVTRHYSTASARAKTAAGFTVYREQGAPRGPQDERELAARFVTV
jgi:hypothetical protein